MNPPTPIQALYANATSSGGQRALVTGSDSWSHERLAAGAESFARAMLGCGVRAGDRVALHLPNSAELVTALFGCFRIGAIAAPVATWLAPKELRAMLGQLRPALYLGSAANYASTAEIAAPEFFQYTARFIAGRATAADSATSLDGARDWNSLRDSQDRLPLPELPAPELPAVLLATSGTTNVPKLVTHTQRTLSQMTQNCLELGFAQAAAPVILVNTPMAHISGLLTLLMGIRTRAELIAPLQFDAYLTLDLIERHTCTWMFGLPFMHAAVLTAQRKRPRRVTSLKFCLSAGDVTSHALREQFEQVMGLPLRSAWASTEAAGSFVHGLHAGEVSRKTAATQIELVNGAGQPVARGEMGELRIRGPHVTSGYWTAPGQIAGVDQDGWLSTGDLMRQGEGEDFWFLGRKKDLILSGGAQITPVEVEEVLELHPAVRAAAVVGMPHATLGEQVVAAVHLDTEIADIVPEDILTWVRSRLPEYKVPAQLRFIEAIPRSRQGKIDRPATRARLLLA